MSAADDMSLLAMQAARMSYRSIARTMGWSEERAVRRLQELNDPSLPPAEDNPRAAQWEKAGHAGILRRACPRVVVDFPEAPRGPAGPPSIEEEPLAEGVGLVLRSFTAHAGGFAANCLLANGQTVFVATGREALAPGKRVPIECTDGQLRVARAAADA